MERRAMQLVGLTGAVLLAAGCARGVSRAHSATLASAGDVDSSGARIFNAAELGRDGRSLLDVLRQRMPGIEVALTADCPAVYLRGRSTITTSSNPGVYVDGTEAINTCVLQSISTPDIHRVEVYPFGVTQRPGYRANPYGLILIFTRGAYQ
jgi:hypothetical protein